MRFILYAVLLLCGFSPVAHAGAQGAAAAATASPAASAINVGDAVRVTVWRNPDLSGQIELAEDGTLIHPLYRSVRAAGLSIPELEAEIREVLLRYESMPHFVIEPLFRVMVGGEVRSPGMHALPPSATVVEAVTLSGGITPLGRADRVRLLRDGRTEHIDLTRPYSELEDVRIRSGDQIIVDPRRSIWRSGVQPALTAVGSLSSLAIVILRLTRIW